MKQTKTVLAALFSTAVLANAQVIISDNYNAVNVGSGFLLGEGVNSDINPPTTRLTGTAAANLRYINKGNRPDTSFTIAGSARVRVASGAKSGRFTMSEDGLNSFDFGPALGTAVASSSSRIEYDITITMENDSAGIERMSLGIGTSEGGAGGWDFGIQLHKATTNDDFYTVSRRMDTGSTGLADDVNTPMLTMDAGTAGSRKSFLVHVTDAGAESSTFHSQVRVSLDDGATWFYDSATDSSLENGWGFDGTGRYFSWDIAGGTGAVTYDNFSVTIVPEPSTLALAGFAGVAFLFWRWRFVQ